VITVVGLTAVPSDLVPRPARFARFLAARLVSSAGRGLGWGVVDDISHEGLRVLLREEGVSFQHCHVKEANGRALDLIVWELVIPAAAQPAAEASRAAPGRATA
jgi:hypothetical protein